MLCVFPWSLLEPRVCGTCRDGVWQLSFTLCIGLWTSPCQQPSAATRIVLAAFMVALSFICFLSFGYLDCFHFFSIKNNSQWMFLSFESCHFSNFFFLWEVPRSWIAKSQHKLIFNNIIINMCYTTTRMDGQAFSPLLALASSFVEWGSMTGASPSELLDHSHSFSQQVATLWSLLAEVLDP